MSWKTSSKISQSFSSPLSRDYANTSLIYVESLHDMGFSGSQALPADTTISVKAMNACANCSHGNFSGDRIFDNGTCDSRHRLGFCEIRGISILHLNYSDNSIRIAPQTEFSSIRKPAYVQIDSACRVHEGQVVQIDAGARQQNSSLFVSAGEESSLTSSVPLHTEWPDLQTHTMLHLHNRSGKSNLTFQAAARGQAPSFAATVILGAPDPCAKDACNPYEICIVNSDVFAHSPHFCIPSTMPGLHPNLPGSKALIKQHVEWGTVEIDECLEGLDTCDEHHTCVDTPGSFSCTPTLIWNECEEGKARSTDPCTSFSLVAELECESRVLQQHGSAVGSGRRLLQTDGPVAMWAALGSTEDAAGCMHEVFKHETCRKRLFKWHANGTETGQCECEYSSSPDSQPILYQEDCTWNQSGVGIYTYRIHVPYTQHSELDCVGPEFKTLSQHAQSPGDCMHLMLATSECIQTFFKFVDDPGLNCMCVVSGSLHQCQYKASAGVSTWKVSTDSCYDGHASFFLSSLRENAVIQSKGVHLLSRNHAYRAMVFEGNSTDALVVYRVSDGTAIWANRQYVDETILRITSAKASSRQHGCQNFARACGNGLQPCPTNQSTTAVIVGFEFVGNGYCRPPGYLTDPTLRVNGRFKRGVASRGECELACLGHDACVGYAYEDVYYVEGGCFLHGAGLDQGLASEFDGTSIGVWQSYSKPHNEVEGGAGPSSTSNAQCRKRLPPVTKGPSSLAVDANTNTNYMEGFCTHTELSNNPWWRVDLETTRSVTSVKIWNRGDCCSDRLQGFEVWIGNDDSSYSENLRCSTGETAPLTSPYEVHVDCIGTGRYLFIALAGTNALSLCEVEVYGWQGERSECPD